MENNLKKYVTKALCCTPETNTILLINYTSIKKYINFTCIDLKLKIKHLFILKVEKIFYRTHEIQNFTKTQKIIKDSRWLILSGFLSPSSKMFSKTKKYRF